MEKFEIDGADVATFFNAAFFIKNVLQKKNLMLNGDCELFFLLMKYISVPNYHEHLRTLYNFFKKYKDLMYQEQEDSLREIWDQMLYESSQICKKVSTKEEESFLFYTLDFFIRYFSFKEEEKDREQTNLK